MEDTITSLEGIAVDCTITLMAYKKGKETTPFDTKDMAFKPKTPLGPNLTIGIRCRVAGRDWRGLILRLYMES